MSWGKITMKEGYVFEIKWKEEWRTKLPFGQYPEKVFVVAPNVDWARGKLRHWLDKNNKTILWESLSTNGERMEVLE